MDIQNLSKYLSAIEASSSAQAQSTGTNHMVQALSEETQNQDSYISSVSQMEDVLPSSTYESILDSLAAYKASLGEDQSSAGSQTSGATVAAASTDSTEGESEASSVSGGGSGSGDSDDSDTTTVVEQYRGPDGSIYLKTTTTDSEGNETVTVTKLGQGPQGPEEEGKMPPAPPEDEGQVPPPMNEPADSSVAAEAEASTSL